MNNFLLFTCITATIIIYAGWCVYIWKNFPAKWDIVKQRKLFLILAVIVSMCIMAFNEFHSEKELVIPFSHLSAARLVIAVADLIFIIVVAVFFIRNPQKENKQTLFVTNKLFDIAFLVQALGFSLERSNKEIVILGFAFLFCFLVWIVISTPREFF